MKVDWNQKYTTVSVYSIITFAVCLLIYTLIAQFDAVANALRTFFSIISPIIWGLAIAYLLNPIMVFSERKLRKLTGKKKPHPKLDRVLSIILTVIVFFVILAAFGAIVFPQVADSVMKIVDNFETYMGNLEKWLNSLLVNFPELADIIDSELDTIKSSLTSFFGNIAPQIGNVMIKITDSAVGLLVALKDFFIGIIVAVYFLFDKEHFQAQLKKAACAFLPERAAEGLFSVCGRTNSSISGFITGKIIDSFIIGCLCFITMTVMKLDYTVLISVIVGVTNVIPFFGPFIGAIPSAVLLLMSSPSQVIPFVILILIIQQLDGNIIGPKILGQSTGISAFWVLFSILVGGGLFGFGGMVLGVPVFAVIYSLVDEFANRLLEKKNMSPKTKDYAPVPAAAQKGKAGKGKK